jgi:hypothetical protein
VSEEAKLVQTSLIDEIQAALTEVKTTYNGDFNAAVEAAERKLGVLREARKYAGVKTEKKPRKAPRKKRAEQPADTEE